MLRPDRSLEEFYPQTPLVRSAEVIRLNPSCCCSESAELAGCTSAIIQASDDTHFVIEKQGDALHRQMPTMLQGLAK